MAQRSEAPARPKKDAGQGLPSDGGNEVRYWRDPRFAIDFFQAVLGDHAYDRHTHDEFGIGAMERGVQEYYCMRGRNFALSSGLITINPDTVHDGCLAKDSPHPARDYRMMYVETRVFEDLAKEMASGNRGTPFFRRPFTPDSQLAQEFVTVHKLFDPSSEDPVCRVERDTRLQDLLTALLRRHVDYRPWEARVAASNRHVRRAREFLNDKMAEKIGLSDVAESVGISPYHLLRLFRKETGIAPHAYLSNARLNRARDLLRMGYASAEIAHLTGFYDQSHFTKRFRRAFGVTPGAYVDALSRSR